MNFITDEGSLHWRGGTTYFPGKLWRGGKELLPKKTKKPRMRNHQKGFEKWRLTFMTAASAGQSACPCTVHDVHFYVSWFFSRFSRPQRSHKVKLELHISFLDSCPLLPVSFFPQQQYGYSNLKDNLIVNERSQFLCSFVPRYENDVRSRFSIGKGIKGYYLRDNY